MTCSSTTHAECIIAFPLQQWLDERATTLLYMYSVYRVLFQTKHANPVAVKLTYTGLLLYTATSQNR